MPSLLSQLGSGELGDTGSIPESGRSPGEGGSNLLQHSCMEKKILLSEEPGRLQRVGGCAQAWEFKSSFLITNSIDSKSIALRRPVQKFLAFCFLQKPAYLPQPGLDLSYPFLLFPNIYPVFLPDSFADHSSPQCGSFCITGSTPGMRAGS